MFFFRMVFCMSMICASSSGFAAEERPKVVVVGAGIAGLTAAYRLHNEGVDVHLYEARNRVGGRIFTVKVNGRIAELGGQNIGDGGEAVHLIRLINELGPPPQLQNLLDQNLGLDKVLAFQLFLLQLRSKWLIHTPSECF